MKIHDGIVSSFVLIYHRVSMQTHNQVISFCSRFLQKIQMSNMEQIESSSYVNNTVSFLINLNEGLNNKLEWQ